MIGGQGQPRRTRNLGMAGIAGLAGLVTVVIVVGGLLLGLWLDSRLGLRGPFTVGLVLLSIPFSLFVMLRIALSVTGAIRPQAPDLTPGKGEGLDKEEYH